MCVLVAKGKREREGKRRYLFKKKVGFDKLPKVGLHL